MSTFVKSTVNVSIFITICFDDCVDFNSCIYFQTVTQPILLSKIKTLHFSFLNICVHCVKNIQLHFTIVYHLLIQISSDQIIISLLYGLKQGYFNSNLLQLLLLGSSLDTCSSNSPTHKSKQCFS